MVNICSNLLPFILTLPIYVSASPLNVRCIFQFLRESYSVDQVDLMLTRSFGNLVF